MTLVAPEHPSATPRFAEDLGAHGDRVALLTPDAAVTYTELDERVHALSERLGPCRRLVLVTAATSVDALVAYLAALRGSHPVVLAPANKPDVTRLLTERYQPDVVITAEDGWAVLEHRVGTAHELHPDLALLLSTSGSTGSAKLVRLSHRNLDANAEAIASYLSLTADDRAITTLPMQYCYGLSVLHSHLHAGASVVLTELSVVDRCFWDLFRATAATSLAGVPHTFDLLDRVGFPSSVPPSLRYITQAGGRLAPEVVRRYAALGERHGWELFVMYGQTEATARMAYLPPHLAASQPHAIGIPVPGGSFTIDAPDGDGVGELVYRGPNVMLGYAEETHDLALGATLEALPTGDLARIGASGLYEVVGRRSRFVKPYGLRVDLDEIERLLGAHGIPSMCTGDEHRLAVAVAPADRETAASVVRDRIGLPRSAVMVVPFDELPRLANGKPDYVTIRRHVTIDEQAPTGDAPDAGGRAAVHAAFEAVLGERPHDADSFVSLGGDSLSYVETSVRLEAAIGTLPRDWHVTPVGELARARRRRGQLRHMETSVVLRAVAIVLIVGNHTNAWEFPGGAHTLLAIAGYNFARFQLRSTRMWTSIARIALPSVCWLGIVAATTDDFTWQHALLLNGVLGAPDARWGYWYIETILQILVPLAIVFAIPAARRADERWPFATAIAVTSGALAIRFDLIELPHLDHRLTRPHEVLWLFALGWAAARATTSTRRLVVSGLIVAAVPGFFGTTQREIVVAAGLLLVLWLPAVPLPRSGTRVVGIIAGASLYIYLTHWQVYPVLLRGPGAAVAIVGSLLAGSAMWFVASRLLSKTEHAVARTTRRVGRAPASSAVLQSGDMIAKMPG